MQVKCVYLFWTVVHFNCFIIKLTEELKSKFPKTARAARFCSICNVLIFCLVEFPNTVIQ